MSRSRCGLSRQHDGGMLLTIDVARLQKRRRDAVDRDAVLFSQIAHLLEFIDGGVNASAGDFRISADVPDAVAREILQVRSLVGALWQPSFISARPGVAAATGTGSQARSRGGSRKQLQIVGDSSAVHSSDSKLLYIFLVHACRRQGSPDLSASIRVHLWAKKDLSVRFHLHLGVSSRIRMIPCTDWVTCPFSIKNAFKRL